eukprot:1152168-Pelagomonas_calceolata.AAC.13
MKQRNQCKIAAKSQRWSKGRDASPAAHEAAMFKMAEAIPVTGYLYLTKGIEGTYHPLPHAAAAAEPWQGNRCMHAQCSGIPEGPQSKSRSVRGKKLGRLPCGARNQLLRDGLAGAPFVPQRLRPTEDGRIRGMRMLHGTYTSRRELQEPVAYCPMQTSLQLVSTTVFRQRQALQSQDIRNCHEAEEPTLQRCNQQCRRKGTSPISKCRGSLTSSFI